MLQLIKLLHDQGNRLMPGTDNGYGFPIHRELELYVKAGIPAAEALRIDTLGAAEYLRQDQTLGTIERGKLADLVVIDRNIFEVPITQVHSTKVTMTMINGEVVYDSAQPFPAKP